MTRTLTLRSLDIPSIAKFGIGFENSFAELLRLSEQQANTNYPPYNVVRQTDDKFYIEIATAGFAQGEVKIELDAQVLTIIGQKLENSTVEYLHHGISNRSFERSFKLGEYVEVSDAHHKDGILTIYLERHVPESAKPILIDIKYS